MYGTARLGLYRKMYNDIEKKNKEIKKGVSFSDKAYCSLVSGFIGSIIGNPADLSLVRM
jgi:solute carrier family 25 oxoglutarate transporter 11